ncbi:antibiotic biosynthesis monooxygenase family protein [Sporosarcina sp. G11-34]|uniref:antibiotic biosynthesis monooxygenase family protein n=1 Tax=Sporosarcina sp. G11-34 TaxID=2849605 RepID=UPI0022A917A6|nr:antibiotic biosynthesis monooxygenase [Sporosarcina sp. G11-34]MCZ2257649.1 antibiotic biosynthesis monooxygenase [Sporosarcina sp. G11-34]
MKIYLTSGTMDFMKSLRKKYSAESMIVMYGASNTVLLHETEGKSLFQTPLRYEVIGTSGSLKEDGYFAFNHIPVTDEGRPIFEHRFMMRDNSTDSQPGFIAIRLLRPLDSNTYIVLTEWENASYYHKWENSASFQQVNKESIAGADKTLHIFSSAPHITKYHTKKSNENEDKA